MHAAYMESWLSWTLIGGRDKWLKVREGVPGRFKLGKSNYSATGELFSGEIDNRGSVVHGAEKLRFMWMPILEAPILCTDRIPRRERGSDKRFSPNLSIPKSPLVSLCRPKKE